MTSSPRLLGTICIFIVLFVAVLLGVFVCRRWTADKSIQPTAATWARRASLLKSRPKGTPIIIINDFVSPEEASRLIALGEPKVQRSTVWEAGHAVSDYRTSYTGNFEKGETSLIRQIEEKASQLSGLPVENIEPIQFLRYRNGQYYKKHYDFFDPAREDSGSQLKKGGQRLVSFFVYLTTLPPGQGGCTKFHRLNKSVEPRCGRAAMWYNVDCEGREDFDTLHSGEPVRSGTKYALNIWIRENKYV